MSASSLHRESTDSLIHVQCMLLYCVYSSPPSRDAGEGSTGRGQISDTHFQVQSGQSGTVHPIRGLDNPHNLRDHLSARTHPQIEQRRQPLVLHGYAV